MKFCSVLFGVLVNACRKQDSLMRGAAAFIDRGRRTTHKRYNQYSTVEMLTTRDGPAVIDAKARYWSKIAIFAPGRGSPAEYCHNVRHRKTIEWCGYPMVKKIENKNVYLFRLNAYERDRHRDGHRTPHMHSIAGQKPKSLSLYRQFICKFDNSRRRDEWPTYGHGLLYNSLLYRSPWYGTLRPHLISDRRANNHNCSVCAACVSR